MSKIFLEIDRQKSIEMPSDLEGWVKSDSLARFVVDIIDKMDTSNIEDLYKVGGSDAYPPTMLLSLLLYCYAKGIFSSRKIEAATYELYLLFILQMAFIQTIQVYQISEKNFSKK